jgi:hypothetical protein
MRRRQLRERSETIKESMRLWPSVRERTRGAAPKTTDGSQMPGERGAPPGPGAPAARPPVGRRARGRHVPWVARVLPVVVAAAMLLTMGYELYAAHTPTETPLVVPPGITLLPVPATAPRARKD